MTVALSPEPRSGCDGGIAAPMDEEVKWTNLTREEIAKGLAGQGHAVSVTVVDQLLKHHDYRRRKAQKRIAGGETENRNEQFLNIKRLTNEFQNAGNPVMSMDIKKKEMLGNLFCKQVHLFTPDLNFSNAAPFFLCGN